MRSGFRQLRGCPLDFQCRMSSVQASPGCRMQLRQARQWLDRDARRQGAPGPASANLAIDAQPVASSTLTGTGLLHTGSVGQAQAPRGRLDAGRSRRRPCRHRQQQPRRPQSSQQDQPCGSLPECAGAVLTSCTSAWLLQLGAGPGAGGRPQRRRVGRGAASRAARAEPTAGPAAEVPAAQPHRAGPGFRGPRGTGRRWVATVTAATAAGCLRPPLPTRVEHGILRMPLSAHASGPHARGLSLSTNHIKLEVLRSPRPQAKLELNVASERRTRRSTFALAPLQGTES